MNKALERLREYIIKTYGEIDYGKTVKNYNLNKKRFEDFAFLRSKPRKARKDI